MSIGHEDPKVSYVRTGRASLDQTVTFRGSAAVAWARIPDDKAG